MFRLGLSLFAAISGIVLMAGSAVAQLEVNPSNLGQSYELVHKNFEAGRLDVSLRMIDQIVEYWGDQALSTAGDRFGHFYYLRGLIYMGKSNYPEAIEAFDTCYEDFPEPKRNLFLVHAIVQKGVCQLLIEDYRDAVKTLNLALEKASPEKKEPDRQLILLNLARAHFGAEDPKKGLQLVYQLLDDSEIKHEYRESAFAILAEKWSPEIEFADVREAVDKYGHIARQAPLERRRLRNPLFHNLAQRAIQKREPLRALLWYAQIAPPSDVLAWHEQSVADMNRRKPIAGHPNTQLWNSQMEAALADHENAKLLASDILFGTGAAHFRLKNHAASFVAFQQLADHYPNYPRQPEALYNIVASAVPIERWPDIRKYGDRFLDNYPKHELIEEVARIMVESVFAREVYDESWTTAQDVRHRLTIGSAARDIPDFVAGASLFHLDRFQESRVELEAYTYHYPDGSRLEPVRYYLGAANVKEFRWETATEILDDFLSDYPSSGMSPGVLFLNGLAHFALGRYERSLAMVRELQKKHPSAEEIPASWNLTGDILISSTEPPAPFSEIENAYLKARDSAYENGSEANLEVAAYALWKLIAIHHDANNWDKAVAYFDQFQTRHANSSHRLNALAAALEGLHQKGRVTEAITLLESNIREIDSTSPQFDELFGTYFDYLKKNLTPSEFLAALRKFSGSISAPPVKNWLTIAEIEHLENQATLAPNTALIEKHYLTLDAAAKSEAMPNYGILKLAQQNVTQKHIARARELFTDIVENRPARGYLESAVLALATLDAASNDPVIVANAFQNFTRIIEEFNQPELYETATIGIARILFDQENFTESESYLSYYLTQNHWVKARAEANYKLACCYEESGQTPQAIKLFAITYVNFPGTLEWSTAAYLKAATLLKDQDRDGDALLVLVDFLKRLGHLEHKNITEGRKLFAEWKSDWIARQNTTPSKS